MLIILGGLPGVGKSTIGKKLAEKLRAVYLRIDSIEQAIKNAAQYNHHSNIKVIAEGYMVAYAIAKDNLEMGLTVIADSVNPIEITRSEYRKLAESTGKPFIEVEIICSDKAKHKNRIETRKPSIPGLKLPTWKDVLERDYENWQTKHLTIDTAVYAENVAVDMIIDKIATEFIAALPRRGK